jgi:thiol-disulfide isomerase/thioredoxin
MRVASRMRVVAGQFSVALAILLAGGCASKDMRPIADRDEFQRQVLASDKPVLVDFYKGGGCPTCVLLHPILNQLADEYRGRVEFASFEAMTPFFQVTSQPLKDRYDIKYFPTAALFVNGQERQRWIIDYNIDSYRKVLDEAIGQQAAAVAPAQAPAALASDVAAGAQEWGDVMVLAKPLTDTDRLSRPRKTASAQSAESVAGASSAAPAMAAAPSMLASKPALEDPSDDSEFVLPLAKVRSRPDTAASNPPPASAAKEAKKGQDVLAKRDAAATPAPEDAAAPRAKAPSLLAPMSLARPRDAASAP